MNPKITPEHLARGAVVYVRQSSIGQVLEHTESQRRQYALAETARAVGFTRVQVIDEDLGRSGSGLVARPGFQRLVAEVCSGTIGAVFSIEAAHAAMLDERANPPHIRLLRARRIVPHPNGFPHTPQ